MLDGKTMKISRVLPVLTGFFIAVFLLLLPLEVLAENFDWRSYNGGDYMTPIRDQGSAGTCWAFCAVGAFEAKLNISYSNPNLDIDLSEQHLVCDGSSGDVDGGYEFLAIDFFNSNGIVTESELPYTATNSSFKWPLESEWQQRSYKISAYDTWITATTDNIKSSLKTYGPLVSAMNAWTDWYWPAGVKSSLIASSHYEVLPDGKINGVNHGVVVVGYHDDPSLDSGGYWIVKNSWGADWGENGYGYILYGDIEQYNRVHALTGEAYANVPEPATYLLMINGLIFGIFYYRKKA
jgi:C1A family cysteine protease